jgi:hypothetical protein
MALNDTDNLESIDVTGNKTLAATDVGIVQNVTVTSTITLPAVGTSTVGQTYIIRNGGSGSTDGKVTINVSPNSVDRLIGNGFTSTDDKDAINTLGRGGVDEIVVVSDGLNGWFLSKVSGTWTREA